MTDENKFEGQSRRNFIKKSAAVGAVATTGVAAFGGQAAAQDFNVNANPLFANGLIVVQGVNLLNFNNTDISVDVIDIDTGDIIVTLEDIEILSRNRIRVGDVDISVIEDSVVAVVVNILSASQTLVGRDTRVQVPQGQR